MMKHFYLEGKVKLKFFKGRERVIFLLVEILYSNEKGHPGEEGITVSPFYWEKRVKIYLIRILIKFISFYWEKKV